MLSLSSLSNLYDTADEYDYCPKFLNCGDTICKNCVKNIIEENENNLICLICNKNLGKINIEDLITNKSLCQIVDKSKFFKIPYDDNLKNKVTVTYKIILVGERFTGKTSIINKFISGTFKNYDTTFYGIYKCCYKINDDIIEISLWDTAGTETFDSITEQLLKKLNGVILTTDVEHLMKNYNKTKKTFNYNIMKIGNNNNIDNIKFCISVNKNDELKYEDKETLKYSINKLKNDYFGYKILKTSAKIGII